MDHTRADRQEPAAELGCLEVVSDQAQIRKSIEEIHTPWSLGAVNVQHHIDCLLDLNQAFWLT